MVTVVMRKTSVVVAGANLRGERSLMPLDEVELVCFGHKPDKEDGRFFGTLRERARQFRQGDPDGAA